jgi:hypothetical protein
MATFTLGHGTKLEYSTTENGSYTELYGPKSIGEVGGTPDRVSTDTLSNSKYHTAIDGLMPEVALDIPFNLDVEEADSNMRLVYDMEATGNEYWFKITYTSGVEVKFKSKVKYSIGVANPNEIQEFTMHLSPVGEPVITLPSASI